MELKSHPAATAALNIISVYWNLKTRLVAGDVFL